MTANRKNIFLPPYYDFSTDQRNFQVFLIIDNQFGKLSTDVPIVLQAPKRKAEREIEIIRTNQPAINGADAAEIESKKKRTEPVSGWKSEPFFELFLAFPPIFYDWFFRLIILGF